MYPRRLYEKLAIEIGSAFGDLLFRLATENPNTFYLGIEINRERYEDSIEKRNIRQLANVDLRNAEAHAFLSNHVDDGLVDELYIYFPTPYPNSLNKDPAVVKQVEQRLIYPDFLNTAYRIMATGGIMRIRTDHHDYFSDIARHIAKSPFISMGWTDPLHQASGTRYKAVTHWERKQLSNGKRIYFVQCIK